MRKIYDTIAYFADEFHLAFLESRRERKTACLRQTIALREVPVQRLFATLHSLLVCHWECGIHSMALFYSA